MSEGKAPHSDVERLAASLDEMCKASRSLGVQLHRVERAAEMLRHLSRLVVAAERERDEARTPPDSGKRR